MGLYVNPGGAQWSYAGFHRFRSTLACYDDIDLNEMEGYLLPSAATPSREVTTWDSVETSLKPLLRHSDCDGFISGWECWQMLPRLQEIYRRWKTIAGFDVYGDVTQLGKLIEGMKYCASHGCAMEFH